MNPIFKQMCYIAYDTIEDERINKDGVKELYHWVTFFGNVQSQEKHWSIAPPLREDGANFAHKVGDEILSFVGVTEDGRTGIVITSAKPDWTHAQMHGFIQEKIGQLMIK